MNEIGVIRRRYRLLPAPATDLTCQCRSKPFSRGHLYRLLSNPIYRGRLPHKGGSYEGRHTAIIDETLWRQVQSLLEENRQGVRHAKAKSPSLLAGLLFTADGEKLVPSHAVKAGRRYRYYIEQRLTRDEAVGAKGARYAAPEIEAAVIECLRRALTDTMDLTNRLGVTDANPSAVHQIQKAASQVADDLADSPTVRQLLLKIVAKITLGDERLALELKALEMAEALGIDFSSGHERVTIETPCHLVRRGQEQRLILPAHHGARPGPNLDPALIRAVAEARLWWTWILEGQVASLREIVARTQLDPSRVTRRLRLAFLAPELVRSILAGSQPADLTLERLIRRTDLPYSWQKQIKLLG